MGTGACASALRRGRCMFASTHVSDLSSGTGPRRGPPGDIASGKAGPFDPDDLARCATTGDAGGAPVCAVPQQKGHLMPQSTNGNGEHGSVGGAKAPDNSPFNKPAPEGAAKKVSEVLGEIVWLMSQSPLHKQFFISDLEWFVMTPACGGDVEAAAAGLEVG
jgi:hypothetical protein